LNCEKSLYICCFDGWIYWYKTKHWSSY
jgi:hypothetical protein